MGASGKGEDVFSFTPAGQLVSASTGRCVAVSGAGPSLALQGCVSALEANDGRSVFELTAAGQLKLSSMGNYCLQISGAGLASVGDCGESAVAPADQKIFLAAVPEWDPVPAKLAEDAAALLKAATARQAKLSTQLKEEYARCHVK